MHLTMNYEHLHHPPLGINHIFQLDFLNVEMTLMHWVSFTGPCVMRKALYQGCNAKHGNQGAETKIWMLYLWMEWEWKEMQTSPWLPQVHIWLKSNISQLSIWWDIWHILLKSFPYQQRHSQKRLLYLQEGRWFPVFYTCHRPCHVMLWWNSHQYCFWDG